MLTRCVANRPAEGFSPRAKRCGRGTGLIGDIRRRLLPQLSQRLDELNPLGRSQDFR
jgi:hypothetical protein